jgi:hypothetical protein
MVLKVLRGKIFRTLQLVLAGLPAIPFGTTGKGGPRLFAVLMSVGLWRGERPRSCAHIRLSKNVDYLIDNVYGLILS